jgi:hypothetical protein
LCGRGRLMRDMGIAFLFFFLLSFLVRGRGVKHGGLYAFRHVSVERRKNCW